MSTNALLRVALFSSAVMLTTGCDGDGGNASSLTPTGGHPSSPAGGRESANWSGYAASGAPLSFNSISGTWTVPSVSCSGAEGTASSTWVGIGGFESSDPTLIQAGTEQDCSDGPTYYAWWEVLPAPSIMAGGGLLDSQSFEVTPGDEVTVTIGANAIVWTITIQDPRAGWTFNTTVPYISGGTSAEWIVEAPLAIGLGGSNGLQTLADFARVDFSAITANGANPHLTADERIVMIDGNGEVVANPSAPADSGDAFRVCFGSGGCP